MLMVRQEVPGANQRSPHGLLDESRCSTCNRGIASVVRRKRRRARLGPLRTVPGGPRKRERAQRKPRCLRTEQWTQNDRHLRQAAGPAARAVHEQQAPCSGSPFGSTEGSFTCGETRAEIATTPRTYQCPSSLEVDVNRRRIRAMPVLWTGTGSEALRVHPICGTHRDPR